MSSENSEKHYDAIFIGSGIGSLTTASLMAQYKNSRVLIIEKHFQPGGFTHEFKRKQNKYAWDVGIHYIGDLAEGSMLRKIFDTITKKGVNWEKMSEPFEKFVFPDKTFAMYGNPEKFQSDLIAEFPDEEEAIKKYFKDVRKASVFFGRHMILKLAPPMLDSIVKLFDSKEPISTLKDYFDQHFKSEKLKGVLASQWGDYGLTPSYASFAIHALVVQHYLNGGYYPVGGAGKIFESIEPIIKDKGGEVLSSTEVQEILIKDGKAVGVRVKSLRGREGDGIAEYYAPVIVSCAGAYATYNKLIPESYPIPFRENLKKFFNTYPAVSNVTVYLGLSKDPRELGFKGENYWIYNSYDHDKSYADRNNWLKDGEIPGAYLSFPSLKNPEAKSHTADIIAFTDYEFFEKWKDQPWKKRDEDYKAFKEHITNKLINYIDSKFPGFKDIVEYTELSTPVTNEHFTGHPKGTIYGLPCVPERFDRDKCPWFEVKTPVSGLYLTGADASSPGVSGAMMGGLVTAIALMDGIDVIKMVTGRG